MRTPEEGDVSHRRVDRMTDARKQYLTSKKSPLFDHFLTPIPSATTGRPADPSDEFENEFRTHFEFELISEQKILQQIIQIFLISNSFQMSSELILGKHGFQSTRFCRG